METKRITVLVLMVPLWEIRRTKFGPGLLPLLNPPAGKLCRPQPLGWAWEIETHKGLEKLRKEVPVMLLLPLAPQWLLPDLLGHHLRDDLQMEGAIHLTAA